MVGGKLLSQYLSESTVQIDTETFLFAKVGYYIKSGFFFSLPCHFKVKS